MQKFKDKERILKAARQKQLLTQESSQKTVTWVLKRTFVGQNGVAQSIQSDKKQEPATTITNLAKLSFNIER